MLALKYNRRLMIENKYGLMFGNFTKKMNHELKQKARLLIKKADNSANVCSWPSFSLQPFHAGKVVFLLALICMMIMHSLKQRRQLTIEIQRVSLWDTSPTCEQSKVSKKRS